MSLSPRYTYHLTERSAQVHRRRRDEHNECKRVLVEWASGRAGAGGVVDVCCGKGGDVYKWRGRCARYFGIDHSSPAVAEARARAASAGLGAATFAVGDAAAGPPLPPCGVVSCMFGLHYFKPGARLNALLDRVAAALHEGGVFVGITVDDRALPPHLGDTYTYELPGLIDPTKEHRLPFAALERAAAERCLHLCFERTVERFLRGARRASTCPENRCYLVFAFVKMAPPPNARAEARAAPKHPTPA